MINVILGDGDLPLNETKALMQDLWDQAELDTPDGSLVDMSFVIMAQDNPGQAHNSIIGWLSANGLRFEVIGSGPLPALYNEASQFLDSSQFHVLDLLKYWLSEGSEIRMLALYMNPYETSPADAQTGLLIEEACKLGIRAFMANAQMWEIQTVPDESPVEEEPVEVPVFGEAPTLDAELDALETEVGEVVVDVAALPSMGVGDMPDQWPSDDDLEEMSAADIREFGRSIPGFKPPDWRTLAPIVAGIKEMRDAALQSGPAEGSVLTEEARDTATVLAEMLEEEQLLEADADAGESVFAAIDELSVITSAFYEWIDTHTANKAVEQAQINLQQAIFWATM